MAIKRDMQSTGTVAPVRERGLKYVNGLLDACMRRRSRKGAWIEISPNKNGKYELAGRSRKGAWIEIPVKGS